MSLNKFFIQQKLTLSIFLYEFLFLKFDIQKDMFNNPGKGVLKMEAVLEEELSGLEYELTEIQNYMYMYVIFCSSE